MHNIKHSVETRQRMSEVAKGRIPWNKGLKNTVHHSIESKKAIGEASRNRKRKPHSVETRQRMSEMKKGKTPWNKGLKKVKIIVIKEKKKRPAISIEARKRMSESRKGKIHSKEHNKKISDALKIAYQLKKRVYLKETGDKISKSLKIAYKLGKFKDVNRSKRYKHGKFYSKKNKKELFYRSSWELQAYQIFEQMSKVTAYEPEPFSIEYKDNDGELHNYIPDILVIYDDLSKELIEIKPACFLNEPTNILKFEAGRKYAQENNLKFSVITKENLDQLKVA